MGEAGVVEDRREVALRAAARFWLLHQGDKMPHLEAACTAAGSPDLAQLVAFIRRLKTEEEPSSARGLARLATRMREDGAFRPDEVDALTRAISCAAASAFELDGLNPLDAFARGVDELYFIDAWDVDDDYSALYWKWVQTPEGISAVLDRLCESPIERRLAAELAALYGYVLVSPDVNLYVATGDETGTKMLLLQHERRLRNGREIRIDMLACFDGRGPFVAVECDGHDYHERTKAQAARDRSRDRDVQADGITVLRFTGSEIHRDAARCASEVDTHLERVRARRGGSHR